MKKKIALLFVCLLILPLLTSCHGTENPAAFSNPVSFDTEKELNLTFWAKNDTNKTQVDIYNKAVSDFEALYPNVHITIRFYTDYTKIYNDVITNISTGTTPNVCITYPDHIATYLTGANVVVPLDDLMTDERYGLGGSEVRFDAPKADEIVPEFLEECMLDGHCYAMPFMRSTEALYINKDMVEKLGYEIPDVVTWDFIWEVSEAAMVKDADGLFAVNGQKVMIPFIYKSTDNMMITMLRQKNAGYSTDEGRVEIFNETTGGLLKEIYTHAKSRAFSTFAISSYPANFLNAGQCIFAVDSTAGATWMGCDAPLLDIPEESIVRFETVVRPVPQFDTEDIRMISQGPSVCIFNKEDSDEVMASWLFVQSLLSNATQIAYSETEGYVPVTLKAQQDPEYTDYLAGSGVDNDKHYNIKIDAAKLLLDNTDKTFVTPVFNGSASLRSAAGQMIENTCKSARRKEEMSDAYLEKLYGDVTSLYRLDQISVKTAEAENETDEEPGEPEPGPEEEKLPGESVALLVTIAAIWVIMLGGRAVLAAAKKKKQSAAKK
ncbi:MAG: extracellular solute-binding protein [Clostridia bacterium]|nr:extracellular solute-binding protein [Clostridia bacterium]